jgi:hypothetical protein
LRAFVVLALGTKHARLSQFGIGIRGRRRRKARRSSPAAGAPLATGAKPAKSAAEPSNPTP